MSAENGGPKLTEEQIAKRIRALTEQAWNHSRPHPQEVEFDQMIAPFQQRLTDFAHVLIIKLAQERML